MKKIFLVLLVLMQAQSSFATDMICQTNESGYVRLTFNYKISESSEQVMSYSVGQERDWGDPYKVRRFCEALRQEIGSYIGETWREKCYGDGLAEYRNLLYSLTEAGSKMLDEEPGYIWFYPDMYFAMTKEDDGTPKVDPSFMRVTKTYDSFCAYPAR